MACTFMRSYVFNIFNIPNFQLSDYTAQDNMRSVNVMQRPPRTSNECLRTTDARKTLWQKN